MSLSNNELLEVKKWLKTNFIISDKTNDYAPVHYVCYMIKKTTNIELSATDLRTIAKSIGIESKFFKNDYCLCVSQKSLYFTQYKEYPSFDIVKNKTNEEYFNDFKNHGLSGNFTKEEIESIFDIIKKSVKPTTKPINKNSVGKHYVEKELGKYISEEELVKAIEIINNHNKEEIK